MPFISRPSLGYLTKHGPAVALCELRRIEHAVNPELAASVELRHHVHAKFNKGEARNALARAVFFNRLGEIRDRSFEQPRYRIATAST